MLKSELVSFAYEFDHVGIAVKSLEEGQKFYLNLGFQQMYVEEVASEKVKVGMFELGNQSRIELLEPTSEDSPIAKFVQKRGEGIHHICLRVKDVVAVMKQLEAQGVQLLSERPRPGAHGCQVVFVHPKSTGGVLLELSQPGDVKGGSL